MRRRRDASGPLSLFAFQDIITSVSGIMVLVVLLLVLEVINAKLLKRPVLERVEAVEKTAAEDLTQVEARVARLRAQLDKIAAERRKVAQLKLDDLPEKTTEAERRRQAMNAETTTAKSRFEELTRRVAALRRELAELNRKRAASQARVKETQEKLRDAPALKPVRYEAKQRAGERVFLVELSGGGITARALGGGSGARFVDPNSVSFKPILRRFETWAAARNPARDVFIVLVKPSAAGYAPDVIRLLRNEMRYKVGFEPLEEDRSAVGEGGAP